MYYFIPLGYNWIVPGQPSGTEARCDRLLRLRRSESLRAEWCHFILTAGKPPGSNRTVTMAEEMADYISYTSKMAINPTPAPLGWGTLAEIQGSILRIKSIASLYPHVQPQVYICTNLGHMFRVKMYWGTLAPKEWKVIIVPANHSFTTKEWFQESAKVARDLFRIATGKIKRTET